jgi:hypothetical protein
MAPRMLDGQSIVAQRVSISEFLFEQMLHEVLYGPLTEDDLLDQDDSEDLGSTDDFPMGTSTSTPIPISDPLSPPKPSCSRRKLKAKLRSAYRR